MSLRDHFIVISLCMCVCETLRKDYSQKEKEINSVNSVFEVKGSMCHFLTSHSRSFCIRSICCRYSGK